MTPRNLASGRRSGAVAAVACLAVLTVSACGRGDDPGTTPTQEDPTTNLTITVEGMPDEGADPVTSTLTCEPVGGDLEGADAACAALADAGAELFEPVPATEQCLQVIEGPGEITVTGAIDGSEVDAMFTQRNSCESERFDTIVATLGIHVVI